MSPLDHLASLLQPGILEAGRAMVVSPDIDALLAVMQERSKGSSARAASQDQQLEAVQRFWQSRQIDCFRDAYLLSGGLCLPHAPSGPCVLEDRPRFQAVLDGVDRWSARPSAFRRCYLGLVRSYFTYDALADSATSTARTNCQTLREYLREKNRHIRDRQVNPSWVDAAIENQQIFSERPCEPYVDALLKGEVAKIDRLCEELGITKASWFLRELILAHVFGDATKLSDQGFVALLPRLLELLANNEVLRDRGLIMLLDRYIRVAGAQVHPGLKDGAVLWWGNPWLPSNEACWGGVVPEARAMVAEWLKLEFIETFFTKLMDDRAGDPRRMDFWRRYVKSINRIEFALGSEARSSSDPDFVTLRKKMTGLICRLDGAGKNNAFIMRMGGLVAVEFSTHSNALYGYDARQVMPFDTSEALRLGQQEDNSLKQKSRTILWLPHQDRINGYEKWEHMFEAALRDDFRIEPGANSSQFQHPQGPPLIPTAAAKPPSVRSATKPSAAVRETFEPYTRLALERLASTVGLQIDDKTPKGGSLWVRTTEVDAQVTKILTRWGFQHKPGKGWWR